MNTDASDDLADDAHESERSTSRGLYTRAALWRRELGWLLPVALLGAVAGGLFGNAWAGLALALLLMLLRQVRNLVWLRAWLQRPKRYELPEPGGLWGEVFDSLVDLQRKNRKKKKKLAAMLAEFRASTAALPDGAVVLGARGEIVWFNSAAHQLLGLRMPQDIGIRMPNLIRHPTFSRYFNGGDFEHEAEVPSPVNLAKTLSLRIVPYGRNQRLMMVRDISERLLLDAARRDFVANASHELRTPLTVLRGYLDLMEMEAHGRGELAPWQTPIGEMRIQTLRMESLVNDMLKLARLESGRAQMGAEVLDAPRMIHRAVDDARQLSRGQHRLELAVEPSLAVIGGEVELHSIFTNLIINAVRYTPAGGVVRVRWEATVDGARFSVADTGIGIAQKDIPRLTERFYRVDAGRSRASGGTGLGLSIVKHALESFDGRLEVDSEVGVGSTFTCILPPHRVTRRVEPGHQAAAAPSPARH